MVVTVTATSAVIATAAPAAPQAPATAHSKCARPSVARCAPALCDGASAATGPPTVASLPTMTPLREATRTAHAMYRATRGATASSRYDGPFGQRETAYSEVGGTTSTLAGLEEGSPSSVEAANAAALALTSDHHDQDLLGEDR